ncbi:MAG: hypothetical protein AMXMBFR47_42010 [Planctomycetota bacterium]
MGRAGGGEVLRDGRLKLGGSREIRDECVMFRAGRERLQHFGQRGLIAGDKRDGGALLREELGCGAADALGTAADDGAFAFEIEHSGMVQGSA